MFFAICSALRKPWLSKSGNSPLISLCFISFLNQPSEGILGPVRLVPSYSLESDLGAGYGSTCLQPLPPPQEACHKFEANLGYRGRLCLKTPNQLINKSLFSSSCTPHLSVSTLLGDTERQGKELRHLRGRAEPGHSLPGFLPEELEVAGPPTCR